MVEKGGVDLVNASLSDRFARFARQECAGSCDLYEHLALRIAADNELLRIASHARPGQPVPNLLFGAVQYLLLSGADHELRRYYDGLVEEPGDIRQSFPPFKDFCLKYADGIVTLLKTKIVQTNEVKRCAYLYPSFCHIYENIRKPLALIEIGTSAGLQLIWDQYGYSYGSGVVYGNPAGEVRIAAAIIGGGDTAPPLLPHSPPVTARIGVDLHINQLSDPEDRRWLRALIWPGPGQSRAVRRCGPLPDRTAGEADRGRRDRAAPESRGRHSRRRGHLRLPYPCRQSDAAGSEAAPGAAHQGDGQQTRSVPPVQQYVGRESASGRIYRRG